jgi:alkylation response protein AidB-like acyl-CoA dehydrogenase
MAKTDWVEVARKLVPELAERAVAHDADDSFVSDSYARFQELRIFSAGIPEELGGGGASHPELCAMLRTLAHGCGSSALALSMHTHLIATIMWRWRHADRAVEPLLRRVAAEQLILVSSGGSDWLEGSGKAEKVEGGFKVSGRKVFSSGCPSGQLFMTMAIYDDPQDGPQVLHVPVPFADGVKIVDTWHTLGMRATGSHDVVIEDVFIPDAAVLLRRPPGKWARIWDILSVVVWPLVGSVYLGVAEAARELALESAKKKRNDTVTQLVVGEMDTQLAHAQLAVEGMVRLANDYDFEPALELSNRMYLYKNLATRACLATVEKAMEAAGGASFFRKHGLERLFRDIQGMRFHPWQEKRQYFFSGKIALGLEPV